MLLAGFSTTAAIHVPTRDYGNRRSVPGWNDAGVFDHQNDCVLWGAGAMKDGPKHRKSRARIEFDGFVRPPLLCEGPNFIRQRNMVQSGKL